MISCPTLRKADMIVTELVRILVGPTIVFVFPDVTHFFPLPYYFHFQEGSLNVPTQESAKNSDLFSSSSPLDKGTKSRTKTVFSLFDEEEDKTEDQNSFQAPKKEVGKVSQSSEGSSLQKDNSISFPCQFCDVSRWIMEDSSFFTFSPTVFDFFDDGQMLVRMWRSWCPHSLLMGR